jgi:nicotinamidase-related amidase
MSHTNTLNSSDCALLIIDHQEGFRPIMSDFAEIAYNIAIVAQAAKILELPILVTEQYPKGLGHTAPEITAVLPPHLSVIEKTAFSSCMANCFLEQLEHLGTKQILVCGIEAHICVNQTTHDLLANGYQAHLLIDCITSRFPHNKQIGIEKMKMSGAIPSSIEMALFELMRDAKHEHFKAIQRLIK